MVSRRVLGEGEEPREALIEGCGSKSPCASATRLGRHDQQLRVVEVHERHHDRVVGGRRLARVACSTWSRRMSR